VTAREQLLAAYRAAVAAVDPRARVRDYLAANPVDSPCYVVAAGKAAVAMTEGALEAGVDVVQGLVIHPDTLEPTSAHARLRYCSAAHPVPDERSIEAGRQALELVDAAPSDARFLFLLSGGASSLVEALPAGGDVSALAVLNQRLLSDGLAIHVMNRVRRAASLLKGGRLGARLGGRRALALFVSDVEGDDPAVIGSGLVVPPRQGPSQPSDMPAAYRELLAPAPAGPSPGDPRLSGVQTAVIAANRDALMAARDALAAGGVPAYVEPDFLNTDALVAGEWLGQALTQGPPGCRIWGAEPTVRLPPSPGQGGRMQALALSAACALAEFPDVTLLAGSTDGLDGVGGGAGAIVDGGTLARGRAAGRDAAEALRNADAGGYLAASGDQLVTGATGTNVMDIVIGWRAERGEAGLAG
jgi:hydroxypyruvate reductase